MINKVTLIGHLGKDPEVRYLDKDRVVANLTLATNERYNDRNGNRVETTEWHNLEMWDGLAKVAEKYLKKGSLVYVEGKLKTEEWETIHFLFSNKCLPGASIYQDDHHCNRMFYLPWIQWQHFLQV